MKLFIKLIITTTVIISINAFAKAPTSYGLPISLQQAKIVAAAAEAEAIKNDWPVAIAIADSGGNLVLLHKIDSTQHVSVKIAQDKAKTAVNARRATKLFQDAIKEGGGAFALLSVEGIALFEGGIPIIVDGKIVGGIGVSGVKPVQDGQVAQAGVDALVKK